jgi:hypothetical protein
MVGLLVVDKVVLMVVMLQVVAHPKVILMVVLLAVLIVIHRVYQQSMEVDRVLWEVVMESMVVMVDLV